MAARLWCSVKQKMPDAGAGFGGVYQGELAGHFQIDAMDGMLSISKKASIANSQNNDVKVRDAA